MTNLVINLLNKILQACHQREMEEVVEAEERANHVAQELGA